VFLIKFPFTKKNEELVSGALNENKVFVFPTETIYGLGGNAFSKILLDKIFKIKERPIEKSVILLINSEWINQLSFWSDSRVNDLIENFWPGPLTLILKANKALPEFLKSDDGTVAIRYTSSPTVQRLIELGNCPIIGTSANISGQPPCSSLRDIKSQLNNKVDFFVDEGNLSFGKASTIVDCVNSNFKVIRHGAISLSNLNRVCKVL
tara:strand:+ start:293 stop:916 length:624 start_codon:yes stop_codon:yes gene_type:complete